MTPIESGTECKLLIFFFHSLFSFSSTIVTISYIDLYQSRERRRSHLSKVYKFDCDCIRCSSQSFIERDNVLCFPKTISQLKLLKNEFKQFESQLPNFEDTTLARKKLIGLIGKVEESVENNLSHELLFQMYWPAIRISQKLELHEETIHYCELLLSCVERLWQSTSSSDASASSFLQFPVPYKPFLLMTKIQTKITILTSSLISSSQQQQHQDKNLILKEHLFKWKSIELELKEARLLFKILYGEMHQHTMQSTFKLSEITSIIQQTQNLIQ